MGLRFSQGNSTISNLNKVSHSKTNGSEGLCIEKAMEGEGRVSAGTWISLFTGVLRSVLKKKKETKQRIAVRKVSLVSFPCCC